MSLYAKNLINDLSKNNNDCNFYNNDNDHELKEVLESMENDKKDCEKEKEK